MAVVTRAADIEEVVVTGATPLTTLRIRTFEAEQKVYEIFNRLNDENEYDIVCHREKQLGTLIPATNCRPNYIDRLMLNYGGEILDRNRTEIPEAVARQYLQELQRRMKVLMAEDAGLRQALADHAALEQALRERAGE